jgi:branched-chain amino acid aminotransferase
MNVFVRINDTIYTHLLRKSLTELRDSFIQLAKRRVEVKVEPIPVKSVIEALKTELKEVWGVGTAVVTTQFQALGYQGEKLELPRLSDEESYAAILKKYLVDLQTNLSEDPFGWRVVVDHALKQFNLN